MRGVTASLAGLVAAGALTFTAAPAASAHDLLPDLGMARLTDLRVDKVSGGRRLLRYSTTIVNVGVGSFEVHGARTSPSEMSAAQRIFDSTGTFRDVVTSGTLVFGGDGHNHWHVNQLETSELIRLDNGNRSGTGAKRGFCFWDNVAFRLSLPNAPQSVQYRSTGCGTLDSSTVAMGLSIGWGDEYPATLPDQYVDITDLTPGHYRLRVTADGQNWFAETDELNNVTWVDIQLRQQGQPKILGYGPTA
jgi:Lysyl oxidase